MRKGLLLFFTLTFTGFLLNAQITTIPIFPLANDTVTIIYDASGGNATLANYSGSVYMHAGVITNLSTSPSDWKYVQGNWGTADPNVLMTKTGPNTYEKKYHLRNFYGVPQSDTILQMAFVFRNATGSVVGRSADGSDIFIDVFQAGLNVSIQQPSNQDPIISLGDSIVIQASATMNTNLSIYVDNSLVSTVNAQTINHTVIPTTHGKKRVRIEASDGSSTVADSFYVYVRTPLVIQSLPINMNQGINYINDSTVTLVLWAPYKNFVFAIGDYSNWEVNDENYMKRDPDGKTYWTTISGLNAGQEYIYQYWVNGQIRIADPYCDKISDPWADEFITSVTYPNLIAYPKLKTGRIASVLQTAQTPYNWGSGSFVRPEKEDLVVYELLLRDFIAAHDYTTLKDTLDYLERLGVNAIEFMPINEFENNQSWGYNPSFYFAPDKYYGPKNTLKDFIKEAHNRGIAVIMDIALNHSFGQNPMVELYWDAANNKPNSLSPWFNPDAKHDFNVGYDFNHSTAATKTFVNDVITYWIDEYHIDGYRFDLSKGFTQNNTIGNVAAWGQYDQTRVDLWKAISDTLWGIDPSIYVILEHFADNSEEKVLADYGMMLWGNLNHNYNEATMGWNSGNGSNFSGGSYKQRGWNDPHLVTYMESHDEERLMFKNITFGNGNATHFIPDTGVGLERIGLAATFFFTIPGPKMIWQFGELGYDYSIDFNGRVGNKPIRWDYQNDWRRDRLYQIFSSLIRIKKEEDVFRTDNYSLDVGGALKRINLWHPTADVVVIGNFDIISGDIDPNFSKNGWWYEFFTGDSINVTDVHTNINLNAGEYRLYSTKKFSEPSINIGIEETGISHSLKVYPNPTDQFVNIINKQSKHDAIVNIHDQQGRLVFTREVNNDVINSGYRLNVEFLNPGLYFIQMIGGNEKYIAKLIKN